VSQIEVIPRCGKVIIEIKQAFNSSQFAIDHEGAKKVNALLGRQIPYIKKLEFPRLFVLHEVRRDKRVEVELEPHVNLLVQYMMHLLSQAGLGAFNVYARSCQAMMQPGFFGSAGNDSSSTGPCLLSRDIVKAITGCDVLNSYLKRLAENWKTGISSKMKTLIPSLWKDFPTLEHLKPTRMMEDGGEEMIDESFQIIHREVSLCCCIVYMYTLYMCFIGYHYTQLVIYRVYMLLPYIALS
jgi:hypothetical protein